MVKTVDIKRKDAVELIEYVAQLLGRSEESRVEPVEALEHIKRKLQTLGVQPAKPCMGDAHSNPYIDNCAVCAPNWGWIQAKVKVK